MQHSKVIAVGIVCLALVVSATVYAQKDYFFGQSGTSISTPSVSVIDSHTSTNDDWKKLLATSQSTDSGIQIIKPTNLAPDVDTDNTVTSQVSQSFFSLFLQAQKNGITIDDTEATIIANQALSNLNISSQARVYTQNDFAVKADSSPEAIKTWITSVAHLLNVNFPNQQRGSELQILSKAIESKNETDISKLDPIIANYKKTILAIRMIPVPTKIFPYDLVYVNTLSKILYDIEGMRTTLTDPAMGYFAFSNYQRDAETLKIVVETAKRDLSGQ